MRYSRIGLSLIVLSIPLIIPAAGQAKGSFQGRNLTTFAVVSLQPDGHSHSSEPQPLLTHGEWMMGILTLIYVLLSFFGLRAIKQQAKIADIAARAAKQSADVLVNAERAWLLIGPNMNNFTLQVTKEEVRFDWYIKNGGRTPARIVETQARCIKRSAVDNLPEVPDYGEWKPIVLNKLLLVPEDSLGWGTFFESTSGTIRPFSEEDIADIRTRKFNLIAYGFVKYLDVFDQLHESRFCHYYAGTSTDPLKNKFRPYLSAPSEYTKCT